jgi:hypothetical protein
MLCDVSFFALMCCVFCSAIPSETYDGDFSFLIDGLAFVSGRPNMAKYTDCAPLFARLDQVRGQWVVA